MMNSSSAKAERLQELHSTVAILQQKRIKQESELTGHSTERGAADKGLRGIPWASFLNPWASSYAPPHRLCGVF